MARFETFMRREDWCQTLAQTGPRAVFLPTTLGALYRYNLRMLEFYHARADALILIDEGLTPDRFEALSGTLAADRVEFRATRTPITPSRTSPNIRRANCPASDGSSVNRATC